MTSPAQYLMPIGTAENEFTIENVDSVNELASGASYSDEIAPPYWDVQISTSAVARRSTRYADWTAFFDNLRGAKRTALLYDSDLQYPQRYLSFSGMVRAGGGSFDGTAQIDVRTSQYEFDLSTLPEDFQLTRGDYVGFVKAGSPPRYFLARLSQDMDGTILGTGTIRVEPKVPPMFDASCTVNFYRPLGEFILVPGSVSRPRSVENAGNFSARFRSRIY